MPSACTPPAAASPTATPLAVVNASAPVLQLAPAPSSAAAAIAAQAAFLAARTAVVCEFAAAALPAVRAAFSPLLFVDTVSPIIGSAGGAEKCALVKSLGADAVIDYKQANGFDGLVAALRAAAPKGIDVYFDNVGGDHLTAAIEMARPLARMALCGMIAQYNETGTPVGPHNIIQAVGKQLKLQGFIVSTHADMQPAFLADMAKWIAGARFAASASAAWLCGRT